MGNLLIVFLLVLKKEMKSFKQILSIKNFVGISLFKKAIKNIKIHKKSDFFANQTIEHFEGKLSVKSHGENLGN